MGWTWQGSWAHGQKRGWKHQMRLVGSQWGILVPSRPWQTFHCALKQTTTWKLQALSYTFVFLQHTSQQAKIISLKSLLPLQRNFQPDTHASSLTCFAIFYLRVMSFICIYNQYCQHIRVGILFHYDTLTALKNCPKQVEPITPSNSATDGKLQIRHHSSSRSDASSGLQANYLPLFLITLLLPVMVWRSLHHHRAIFHWAMLRLKNIKRLFALFCFVLNTEFVYPLWTPSKIQCVSSQQL